MAVRNFFPTEERQDKAPGQGQPLDVQSERVDINRAGVDRSRIRQRAWAISQRHTRSSQGKQGKSGPQMAIRTKRGAKE